MDDLSGLRVLDLGWIWAGPLLSSALAELGADVVKIESQTRLDPYRLRGVERDPRYDSTNRHEASPSFHKLNRGKRSVTVDLRHDGGRELVLRLAESADLLVENFSAGTAERLGLGWDALKARNPKLVAVSMSGGGQSPRWRELRAYALVTTALSGYESLVGYPGEDPIGGPTFGIADPNVTSFALLAAGAALWRARNTGTGVYLDVSGIESMIAILGTAFLTDGRPEGGSIVLTLPSAEEDGWVVTVLTGPNDLASLVRLGDLPAVGWTALRAGPAEFESAAGAWSSRLDSTELRERLAAAGLPAAPVWSIEQRDASELTLATLDIEHPVTGVDRMPASPWGTSHTPTHAPLLGHHTDEVLREWLGLPDEEIAGLHASGALG